MVPRGGLQQVRKFKALQREGRKRKRPSKPRNTRLEVMQRRAVGSYVRKASKPPKWSQPAWPRASHRHLSCGMAIRLSTWQTLPRYASK